MNVFAFASQASVVPMVLAAMFPLKPGLSDRGSVRLMATVCLGGEAQVEKAGEILRGGGDGE